MSFSALRSTVETYVMQNWDSNACPLKFSNVAGFVKGTNKIASTEKLACFAEVDINYGATAEADINSNHRIRSVGTIAMNVYVKVGTGTAPALDLADTALKMLQLKELVTNLTTRAGRIMNIGQAQDEGYYQISVQVPYYYDYFEI